MKLHILSDLHLSGGELELPRLDADITILAGDLGRPEYAIRWASRLPNPVLYVLGNHEYYGSTIAETVAECRQRSAETNVRILADDEVIVGGVRFLGTTLWTDFMLDGSDERRDSAMREGQRLLHDFRRIRQGHNGGECFTPADAAASFEVHASWLARKLSRQHPGPTVVITHHAPSRRSIHRRFRGSMLNACFASNADHLIDGRLVTLWVHGHTHDSFDYHLNDVRVVCNPRGYVDNGVCENPCFDPAFQLLLE